MEEKMHYLKVVYVSKNGDDATGDGSKEKPFATTQKAVDAAENNGTVFLDDSMDIGNINSDCYVIEIKPWSTK